MLIYDNVCASYGKEPVIENVFFSIKKGTITAVIGKNGSGKSTLLLCSVGMVKYDGKISYNGNDLKLMNVRERAKNISYLPQILNAVPITVSELVKMGRNPYLDVIKHLSDKDIEYVQYAIRVMGLQDVENSYVNQISGGERQKAYIAMVLAQNTDVIIFDEPTAHMDMEYTSYFTQLLSDLKNKFNKTVIVISHDITSVCDYADNIILLNNKTIEFNGSTAEFIEGKFAEKVFGAKKIDYVYNGENKVIYR